MTLGGMVTCSKELQFCKALERILVAQLGKAQSVRELQP